MSNPAGRKPVKAPKARKFIVAAGGVAAVAEALRVSRPAVRQWTFIPAERVLALEPLTGKYDRYDMRPDVYGKRPRDKVA